MGIVEFLFVWVPVSLTMLVAGVLSLRYARMIRDGDAVSVDPNGSPVASGSVLPSLPTPDPGQSAREYRLFGIAMLVGSVLSFSLGIFAMG